MGEGELEWESYRPAEGYWVGQMCEFWVRKLWSLQSEKTTFILYTVKNKETIEKQQMCQGTNHVLTDGH